MPLSVFLGQSQTRGSARRWGGADVGVLPVADQLRATRSRDVVCAAAGTGLVEVALDVDAAGHSATATTDASSPPLAAAVIMLRPFSARGGTRDRRGARG